MATAVPATHRCVLVVARPERGRAIAEILAAVGLEVHRTPDAANALSTARRLHPDLAVITLDLPWFDGLDAVEALRVFKPPLPLVVLGEVSDAKDIRGVTVLPNAVDRTRLLEAVTGLLDSFTPFAPDSATLVADEDAAGDPPGPDVGAIDGKRADDLAREGARGRTSAPLPMTDRSRQIRQMVETARRRSRAVGRVGHRPPS
jgi:DNA-binding NarL/FixJ family response regulator